MKKNATQIEKVNKKGKNLPVQTMVEKKSPQMNATGKSNKKKRNRSKSRSKGDTSLQSPEKFNIQPLNNLNKKRRHDSSDDAPPNKKSNSALAVFKSQNKSNVQNKKNNGSMDNKNTNAMTSVHVEFPENCTNYKQVLQQVLAQADVVLCPQSIDIGFKKGNEHKITEVSNLTIDGHNLKASKIAAEHKLKKTVVVKKGDVSHTVVQQFFGAKSVELFPGGGADLEKLLLTFESANDIHRAQSRTMKFGTFTVFLKQYFEDSALNVQEKKSEPKINGSPPKKEKVSKLEAMLKEKLLEARLKEEKKQNLNKQTKKTVEEEGDEEDSDESGEEEELGLDEEGDSDDNLLDAEDDSEEEEGDGEEDEDDSSDEAEEEEDSDE